MSFDLAEALKDVSASGAGREQIEYIPLEKIDASEGNFYSMSEVEALADNIALCGLQQPIRLRAKDDGRYNIVSGHRRRAALLILVSDGYEQYREAPCIVERDEVSPALQQLRLIYANANTRKMSPAEISEQAVQVEKLLYQLKEEGYAFPGRMRDHVAEAVSVSKSKLARLKVIREKLDDSWSDAFKDGSLTESQAYALAQRPKFWQSIIKEKWGYSITSLHADTITKFWKRFENVQNLQCQHGLIICEHTVTMMEKNVCSDWQAPCTGCCFDCDRLQNCKSCCPQALSKQKEMKATAKKAQLDAKRAQEERNRPGAEFARMVWGRIGKARERSGTTVKDIVLARGESFYNATFDDPKQKKMESGEGDYNPNSTISFGYNITSCEMMKVVAVADALKCSVDYLLGRTDDRESHLSNALPEIPVFNSGTFWQTGTPATPGDYLLWLSFGSCCDPRIEKWTWDGCQWHDETSMYDPNVDGEILYWISFPKLPEKPKPATNESCITGMSPSGHCGAAAYCANEYACCLQCPEDCNGRCGWMEEDA